MNSFDKYQEDAERTSGQAGEQTQERLVYATISLGGEVGELLNYIKKGIWHGHGVDKLAVQEEIGDLFWYMAEICSSLGLSLSDVAEMNIEKLKARYPQGFSEEASKNRKA